MSNIDWLKANGFRQMHGTVWSASASAADFVDRTWLRHAPDGTFCRVTDVGGGTWEARAANADDSRAYEQISEEWLVIQAASVQEAVEKALNKWKKVYSVFMEGDNER